MENKAGKKKKNINKLNKNKLPVLDQDHDFLKIFEKKEKFVNKTIDKKRKDFPRKIKKNKHGLPVLDIMPGDKKIQEKFINEDFAKMLCDSFKNRRAKPINKIQKMPLKKRLKRYPPVELELDLHGYTAIGARVKADSFISNCKYQGFFTIRIIVGKGLHSDIGPVLPDVVEDVVRQKKKQDIVIAYEWDKKKKSKSGAVIVYLKQFEQFD